MADEIRNDAANAGREVAGGAREVAGSVEQGLGNVTGNAGMIQGGQQLAQSGAQERTGMTPGAAPSAAPSSAVPAHESLADAVEGLREDAGTQGRTLEQAEQQGVLEVGHDGDAPTPGFIGDHRDIDTSGQLALRSDYLYCSLQSGRATSGTASALFDAGTLWTTEKEKAMADNQNSNPNGSEDQTRPAGDWDKQYIAPPDANMGAQDTTTQGRAAGSVGSHEYGGSATDSRVSDSRSNASHHRDSGAEAGLMGSAYDTERQMQGGTPGSGANAPTSADMAGLNSSNDGATNSGSNVADNSVGGMLSSPTLGGAAPSGPAGGGASGGQLGDTMGRGSLQEGTAGGATGSGVHGISPTGGDLSGSQSMSGDTTGGTPALGDPTRTSSMMTTNQVGDADNAPDENAERVTGHRYDNDFGRSGAMGGGVMQSDLMRGSQQGGNDTPASLNSRSTKPSPTRQGDDRDSTIGDRADSAGRHDNPYDTVRPAEEHETPETIGGLNGNSGAGDALEGQSHLYTPGTTEEDFPAT